MSADLKHTLPENIFRIVFEKSPGSILVKADIPRFTILAASDTYLKVTSSTREAIIGKGFFEVFPDETHLNDANAARTIFTQVIKTGQKIDVPTYQYDVYNADTGGYEQHFWSCSNVPVLGDDNKIAYILNTVTDITGEVKAKEAAIESENRLRLANEATGLATWDLDMRDQSFVCSPGMADIFGHPAGTVLSLEELRSQISADDFEHIVRRSHQKALFSGRHLYEVRIIWPDNSAHWIKAQGMVLFDEQKQPIRMLGTILDITENKRDEIRKNDFIAMASHELKTPLTSLKAYIQLLTKKLAGTDDAFISNALIKAGNQVNKMADLIYGFLDLSRLEPGKLQLKIQQFDMNKLIANVIAETNPVNYTHSIIFKPHGELNVNADRDKIGQVISNFLSNAIKYSPKESTVTLSAKIAGDNVLVAVADKGIGVKLKDQEKIFQRFYRAESDHIKTISGFGIGLYLASEIIQRHKGKIWVESEEDKGSTFYFSLPL